MNVINIDKVSKLSELISVGNNWYARLQKLNKVVEKTGSGKAMRLSNEMFTRMKRLCYFLSTGDLVQMPNWMINILIPEICTLTKN